MKQNVWLAPVYRLCYRLTAATPFALTSVLVSAWMIPVLADGLEEQPNQLLDSEAMPVPLASQQSTLPPTAAVQISLPTPLQNSTTPNGAAVAQPVTVQWGSQVAQTLPPPPPLPISVPTLREEVFEAAPAAAPAAAPVYVLIVPPTTPGAVLAYPVASPYPSVAPTSGVYPAPTAYPAPVAYPAPGAYPIPGAYPAPGGYATPMAYPAPATYPTPMAYPAPGAAPTPGAYPAPGAAPVLAPIAQPTIPTTALTPSSLTLQGVAIYEADDFSARVRVSGVYPLSPRVVVGGTLDLIVGEEDITNLGDEGINLNELYVAVAPESLPTLRFIGGQVDLTSYFDRNSFAKDGTSQFFNDIFQTNPALAAANIGSRPGLVVNWSVNDNVEARVAGFSSAESIGDFQLDGFAGELGFRVGNAILRGTYVSSRDTDISDDAESDRLESYGLNAEVFIPEINLGLFARYGQLNSQGEDFEADTYSAGLSLLDLFVPNDRLGVAYGRNLSDQVNRDRNNPVPDALEVFYDFPVLSNLRLGFTLQQVDDFSETIGGIRVRTDFDVTPRSR